jgi:hypothetical protein
LNGPGNDAGDLANGVEMLTKNGAIVLELAVQCLEALDQLGIERNTFQSTSDETEFE